MVFCQETKLSLEDMRHATVSHIISGDCARSMQTPPPWVSQKTHGTHSTLSPNENESTTCSDFVRDAELQSGDDVGNEMKNIYQYQGGLKLRVTYGEGVHVT